MNKQNTFSEKFRILKSDFSSLTKILFHDIEVLQNLKSQKSNKNAYRRFFIHSIFSYIDSYLSFLKSQIALTGEVDYLCLDEEEEIIILGRKGKGNLRNKPKRLPLSQDIKFTIQLFLEINYSFSVIDYKTKDWNQLIQAIKVRNRIIHPKKASDLLVMDKEFNLCNNTILFFLELMKRTHQLSLSGLRKTIESAESVKKAVKKIEDLNE